LTPEEFFQKCGSLWLIPAHCDSLESIDGFWACPDLLDTDFL
jgi:hypothetical protein